MTTVQGVGPTSAATVSQSHSTLVRVSLLALAVLTALALAGLFGDTSLPGRSSFTPYDWARSGSTVVGNSSSYPASGGFAR